MSHNYNYTRTPKKPKSKRPGPSAKADAAVATAGPSDLFKREGTKDSPIALGSDDEEAKPGQKRKRYSTVIENGKKRRVVDEVSPLTANFWQLKLTEHLPDSAISTPTCNKV
jgi:hypothetical protein